jgi:MFS family permease
LLPVGMIVVGWLDGLIGRIPSVLLSYAVSLLGVALLWLLGRFPSVWLLGAFVVCFGSTLGSRGPLISTIGVRLFGGRDVATILGTIGIGGGLGAALGSWIGGVLHDWSGSYEPGLLFAALSIAGGALPFLTVPTLRR